MNTFINLIYFLTMTFQLEISFKDVPEGYDCEVNDLTHDDVWEEIHDLLQPHIKVKVIEPFGLHDLD